jgi:hypothetical protein
MAKTFPQPDQASLGAKLPSGNLIGTAGGEESETKEVVGLLERLSTPHSHFR